jgi:hypothetical protein
MTKAKKHEYCGKCVFCCSKCPRCGSTKVDVTFMPEYRYLNRKENYIEVKYSKLHIELKCKSCRGSFDQKHKSLKPLAKWMADHHFYRIAPHYIQSSPSGEQLRLSGYKPSATFIFGEVKARKRGN